mgnify:CR=1 FL=1
MNIIRYPNRSDWAFILKRSALKTDSLQDTVREILDKVRTEGDKAVKEYEEKFLSYINDDMNMPGAMSVVWDIARNTKKSAKFANLLLKFDEVLGLDMKNAEKYLVKFKQNDSEELPAEIKKLVEELKSQEQEIVMLRYYKGKTQTEVAKKLGISQVQVSRIEKRILYSMKQKLVI